MAAPLLIDAFDSSTFCCSRSSLVRSSAVSSLLRLYSLIQRLHGSKRYAALIDHANMAYLASSNDVDSTQPSLPSSSVAFHQTAIFSPVG